MWRRGEPPDWRDHDGNYSYGKESDGQQHGDKVSIGKEESKGELVAENVNYGMSFANKLPCLIMHQCVGRQGSLLTEPNTLGFSEEKRQKTTISPGHRLTDVAGEIIQECRQTREEMRTHQRDAGIQILEIKLQIHQIKEILAL